MPPAEKLVDDEISVIEDWMRGGALCD